MDYLINTPVEMDRHLHDNGSNPRQFAPNEQAMATLIELGYHREDALYALRVTCSFLIANPNPATEPD